MNFEQETKSVSIESLIPYQNRFNVSFKVIEKSPIRETTSHDDESKSHRLCDITVADKTATIILTAWDNDIDLLEVENYYELTNGFVNVFHESMRLSRGKFGNINKVDDNFVVNMENDRSSETHEGRQRKTFNRDNFNSRRSFNNNDYGSYRRPKNDRSSSDTRKRW